LAKKTPGGKAAASAKPLREGKPKGSGRKAATPRPGFEYHGAAEDIPLTLATLSSAPELAEGPTIEAAIGAQVRALRKRQDMTVSELASQAGLSAGMLSKVENGAISPSLATLQSLAGALNVPLTSFFADFEQQDDATHVRAGEGLTIERRGSKAGHRYQLLGHAFPGELGCEPYFITLRKGAEPYSSFRHEGMEFIYLLEGEVDYRHGGTLYRLKPGDSLFFDARSAHGPEVLRKLPLKFLSVIVFKREG
jgi:transcriptional regulator with XRE-family HTH domain